MAKNTGITKEEAQRLIEASVKEHIGKEREKFEKIFEGVPKSRLEEWLMLDDFEFYRKTVNRMKAIKCLYKDSELEAITDVLLEYTGKNLNELVKHIETEEGKEDLDTLEVSTMRLAGYRAIGVIAFTTEGVVLTGSFAGRVILKAGTELYKAVVNTTKYAVADSKNYGRAVKSSWYRNVKHNTLKETIRDRANKYKR